MSICHILLIILHSLGNQESQEFTECGALDDVLFEIEASDPMGLRSKMVFTIFQTDSCMLIKPHVNRIAIERFLNNDIHYLYLYNNDYFFSHESLDLDCFVEIEEWNEEVEDAILGRMLQTQDLEYCNHRYTGVRLCM